MNQEIEAKFLEIKTDDLIKKLHDLEARDFGEKVLKEIIFYDKAGEWRKSGKSFVRIREDFDGIKMTYKHIDEPISPVAEEIEFEISDVQKATALLERAGLEIARKQEKKRHKFKTGDVIIDIDTWPNAPTYVEVEGPSEESIKEVAERLGFDYQKAVFGTAAMVLEKYYNIPIRTLKEFTFNKIQ